MAAAWCSAARRPASSTHRHRCVTRRIFSAFEPWRATGSAGSGLRRAMPASRSSTRAPANCDAYATRPRGELTFRQLRLQHRPPAQRRHAARHGAGLDRLSAANLDISRLALPPELVPHGQPLRVRALTESPDGMVWVGTDAGLGRFDPRNERWRVIAGSRKATPPACPMIACSRCSSTARGVCGLG